MSNGYDKFWETVERSGKGKRPESQQQDKKIPGSDIFWKTVGLEAPSTQSYPQQSGVSYIDSKLKEYGLYEKTSRPVYSMWNDVSMEKYGYDSGITEKDVGYSPRMKESYDSFLSGREKSKPMPEAVKSQIGDLQKQIDALTGKISFAQENYDTVGAHSLLEQQRQLQTKLYQLQAENAESEYDRYMAQYKLHNQSFLKLLDGDGSGATSEDYRNYLENDKAAVAAKDNAGTIDYIAKYADKERKDNFGGQFAANYDLGTISQDSAIAWDDYLDDPTEENRKKAEALSVAAQEYQAKNADALDDENAVLPWITKSLANYLPQFIDQQAMQIPLGIITAAVTLNPANYKYGATVGSGVYSYRTMRGAAYRSLLDAGVPEEKARAAAKDEAVISSMIEMGETFLSLSAFGMNKLSGGAIGNAGAKITGALESKLPSSAARALLKAGKALAAYGINIFSESQEERSQEAVSIANENRDYTQDTGIGDLAYDALKKYIGGFTGNGATEEEIARMKESEAEGAKLAAMLGGVETAQAAILNGKMNASAKRYNSDVSRMIDEGMESPEGTKSRKYAEEAKKKVDAGKTLSGYQIRELAEANKESILSQDVGKITKAVEKQLTDRGYDGGNTKELAAAIAKTVAGQDTTRAERKSIRNSEQAKQILQEIAGASDVVQNYAESGAAYEAADQKAEIAGEELEQAQNDVSMDADFQTAAENFRAADEKRTAAKEAFDAAQNEYENGSTAWARQIGARVVGDGILSENSVEGYSHLFGKHAKLFTEAYEDGQDARQYTIEFAKAYNEGTKGGNLQSLIDSGSLANLSTVQINAAYQAGLDARNSLNTRRDTDGLHLRQSSIWENGANSTADVQEVEANAEQDQKRNADSGRKTAAEKAAGFTAEKAYRRVTTLEELGVKDAKAGIKVTQVSSDYSDETAKAYEMCAQNGVKCIFFTGGYLQTKDGIIARGANKDGVVYIRADDPNFTANEIAGHEIGHELVNRGSLDMDAVISEVRKEYTKEELSKIVDDYGLDFLASGVNEDELTDITLEEITCDALGGMNAFASNREGNAEFVQKLQGLAEKHYTGKTGEGTDTQKMSTVENDLIEGAKPVDPVDVITDGVYVVSGDSKYSMLSMKSDIAEGVMFRDLLSHGIMNETDITKLKSDLESLLEYMNPNRNILDMNETYGREGRRFSPYKPNSDPLYKISMDFSTLCSKRLLTQYVIEQLQLRENRPMTAKEQMAIRAMLNDYRQQENALQVACAMCYVEAARLKSPGQMEKWMNDPMSGMKDFFSKKNADFNKRVKDAQAKFKVDHGYAADTAKKGMKASDVTQLNKIGPKMRAEYQMSPEEAAIAERAAQLPRSTYLTAANLANLRDAEPEIYSAYTTFIRNATRSKALETDEPYYYGDSTRDNGNGVVVTDSFIEAVNKENGMRFSSWSDWRIQHMLDYITAVIDNSVRGAAMHGYTKFTQEVRVLGKTGMMFNLSGVPGTQNGLNPDGSLSFSDTESIAVDQTGKSSNDALAMRDMFPETAGLQCIGVSDAHIHALLASDIIDYVIPYHTSGLNASLRRMAGIYGWKDYTNVQNAKIDSSIKGDSSIPGWHVEPVFSEFFVGYNTGMTGIEAMRKSAENYINMCRERGMTPKFEAFTGDENYWKLLIDRKMINQNTGKLIQQKPVKPVFDFAEIRKVVDETVENYDSGLESRALAYIVENWDSVGDKIKELEKAKKASKTKAVKNVDTLANEMLAAQQKGTEQKLSAVSEDLTAADKRELAVGDVISMKQQKNLFADRQTGEIVKYSVVNDRTEIEPLRNPDGSIKYVYKAFYAMDGKLYPPMVANLTDQEKKSVRGAASGTMRSIDTPVGVWLRADVGTLGRYRNDATEYDVMFRKLWSGTSKPVVELKERFKQLGIDGSKNRELAMRELEKVVPKLAQASKTKIVEKKGDLVRNSAGRLAVENAKGGDTLAFRPGWHLGEWPDAKQFNKDSKLGKKSVMPDGLVFAKCMIAGSVDYQLDAMSYGVKENGKYDRTQAGLPTVPENGYYKYRTNPDPKTAPWYITGAMKVVEILDDDDCARICAEYGVTADPRESFRKIDLAKYGLKRGPVTAPSDLKPYEKSQQSYKNDADLQAALSDPAYAGAYVKRSIDFDDPEILKEFERNGQSAEEYRKIANGGQDLETADESKHKFSTVNSTQLALENPDVYDEIQVTYDEILQKTKGKDLEAALLEEAQKHSEDLQLWEHEAAVLTKLWKQNDRDYQKVRKALDRKRKRIKAEIDSMNSNPGMYTDIRILEQVAEETVEANLSAAEIGALSNFKRYLKDAKKFQKIIDDINENGGANTIQDRNRVKLAQQKIDEITPKLWTIANNRRLQDLIGRTREALIQKYGTIPEGENASRESNIPMQTSETTKVSRTARTAVEASGTTDEMAEKITEKVVEGGFSYVPISDDGAKRLAEETIKRNGFNDAALDWFNTMGKTDNPGKNEIAMGWTLYNNAVNAGDTKTAMKILTEITTTVRNAAQTVQANRILKQLSPENRLYAIRKQLDALQQDLNSRYGDKAPQIDMNSTLVLNYLSARGDKDIRSAEKALYQNIASQLPNTFLDKWNSWRYLSMLGNMRTHIRNIAGNVGFMPVRATKDAIAALIESGVNSISKDGIERTKGILIGAKDRGLYNAGVDDFKTVSDLMENATTKSSDTLSQIERMKPAFGGNSAVWRVLSKASEANSWALGAEDMVFKKITYASAFGGYLKAHDVTESMYRNGELSDNFMDQARAYAMEEALKATYNDCNAFSDFVARVGKLRYSNNIAGKVAGNIVEGILPFKRTPANILVRSVEYSPIGLMNGIKKCIYDVRAGKSTAAEAVDALASGLTGTLLLGLGYFLANLGLIDGGEDDDKKQSKFDKLRGDQSYSLVIGDKSYTIDWLAPEVIPMFVGAEIQKFNNDGNMGLGTVLDALSRVTEPLLEMSMLSGLNDMLDNISYSDKKLYSIISTAAASYVMQGLPTIMGQIERTGETVRETTYVDKESDIPKDMQYTIAKAANKIPGIEYNQIPYIDAYGRQQKTGNVATRAFSNFLSPGYIGSDRSAPWDDELQKLYDAGQTNVFPVMPDDTDIKGYVMDGDELVKFRTAAGEKKYELLEALFDSVWFNRLPDEDKADCISKVYSYANAYGKKQIVETFESSTTNEAIHKHLINGGSIVSYFKNKMDKK